MTARLGLDGSRRAGVHPGVFVADVFVAIGWAHPYGLGGAAGEDDTANASSTFPAMPTSPPLPQFV